jgi:hypothetical protein
MKVNSLCSFERQESARLSLLATASRLLASPILAVLLIISLAAVLACGTWLEASHGREFARWYVYGSPWLVTLLLLLCLNIFFAMLVRWPWKKNQLGLLLAQAGLLVLLIGAIQTFIWGTEGQLSLKEGESCDHMVTSRSVITTTHLDDGGQVATDFTFTSGPTDWPAGKSLDFGQEADLGLKIVKFIRHARERVDWVADASDYEGPALELRLCGPGGGWVDEDWLAASLFGGEAVIGPTMYRLWPLPVATMVEDFLHPPSAPETILGTLSIHHEGATSAGGCHWAILGSRSNWSNAFPTPDPNWMAAFSRAASSPKIRCWN